MSPTYPPKIISINKHFLLILSQNRKNIKNRAKSHPFLTPVHFHFSEVKRSILEKVIFRRIGRLENFQIWKGQSSKSPRNLREISSRFHRDFIEISLVASQKRRKKENFFTCLRPIFEKLASTLIESISAPLQDRNFKFCRHIPYPTH